MVQVATVIYSKYGVRTEIHLNLLNMHMSRTLPPPPRAWRQVVRDQSVTAAVPRAMLLSLTRRLRPRPVASIPPSLTPLSLGFSRPLCTVGGVPVCREWTPVSARVGAVGMKCGMTTEWTAEGKRVPITIVELQDLQVVKRRTEMVDGFNALQLGGGWQKRKRMTLQEASFFESRGLAYKRYLREFQVSADALLPIGTTINARHFVPGQFVDVQGVTRGKGFQGVMKRWGFKGQPATHGTSLSHRSPGSLGGAAGSMYGTKVWKGKKMPGNMGNKRRTMRGLLVWKVSPKYNLVYLKGSIPGATGSMVRVQDSKHRKQVFSEPPPFPTFIPSDPSELEVEELLCADAMRHEEA